MLDSWTRKSRVELVAVFVGSWWIVSVLADDSYARLRTDVHFVWLDCEARKGRLTCCHYCRELMVHEPPSCWRKVRSPHRRPLISFRINWRLIHLCVVFIFVSPVWGRLTLLCGFIGLGLCPPKFLCIFSFFFNQIYIWQRLE